MINNIKRLIIKSRYITLCLLCVVSLATHKLNAQEDIIRLTATEWPPFTSKDLKQEGACITVVRNAYKAMGYKIEVTFLPWGNAIQAVKDSDKYAGFLCAYDSKERRAEFIISEPIGLSPLGFAQHNDAKISWSEWNDLKKYRIGVISDYVNYFELDRMIEEKELKTEESIDDATALRKLVMKRLDIVLIDKNVMNHILKYNETLKSEGANLSFNKKIIKERKLHVVFRKDEKGIKINNILKEGLKKTDVKGIMNEYINQ